MEIRNASIKDLKNIADSVLEFGISEGIKRENVIYKKVINHIKNNFFCDSNTNFKKIILDEKGLILGGLFMEISNNYYDNELFLDDISFFTSPELSKYKRMKIAVTLLKKAIEWAFDKKLKFIRMNMVYRRPSIIRFMEKIGFYVSSVSYEMELKSNV